MKQNTERRKLVDRLMVVTTLVCLLPILLGLAVYSQLPEQVAVHWNAAGEPDGWMPKAFAVWVVPAVLAAINALCHVAANADPKREAQSQRLLTLIKWFPAAVSVVITPCVLLTALGREVPIPMVVCCIVGVVAIVIGNYLPKCRQNYTMGIKVPWTLNDEDNWNKTHRLAGPLYIMGGLLMIAGGFFGFELWGFAAFFVMALFPIVYSFYLSRKAAR